MEDHLRAVGYVAFALWSVAFLLFPPISVVSSLDTLTRVVWMSLVCIGAVVAFIGAERRIDFKMEFPGLLLLLLGPLFYFVSQAFYVLYPTLESGPPVNRYALAIYATLPGLALIPRTYSLWRDSRRQKKINLASIESARMFLESTSTGEVRTVPARNKERK